MNHHQRSKTIRLQVEALESRRLMAGLNVSLYIDQNLSGNYEALTDRPAANRIVYIDLNRSGAFDDVEPVAITNQDGNALFTDLETGDYSVGLLTNEQIQTVSDPVTVSQTSTEPISPDVRKLPSSQLADVPFLFAEIREARQLDYLVELENGQGFVGAKRVGEVTLLELIDQHGELTDSMVIAGRPTSLIGDRGSRRVAVATDRATHVISAVEWSLVVNAVLADATAPLALGKNHLVSADRSELGGWIVWNARDWQPARREKLADEPLLDVGFSEDGKSILALSVGALHQAQWISTNAQISVDDSHRQAQVRMGVQVMDDLPPITVPTLPIRQTVENTVDRLDLRALLSGFSDLNLWFTVGSSTRNGLLEVDPSGKVVYAPNVGFVGEDQALVRVFDGATSSEITLGWEVSETNQPPSGIIVDIPAFAESTHFGSEIGFVTIIDPNAGAAYRVTTSDPRFRVENGRVTLQGVVDFEQEPHISVEFSAVDEQELFSISATATLSLINTVEPPSAVLLSNLSVNEKTLNAVVGQISFLNPDSAADYQVAVSDSRFVVQGNQLVLLERLDRQNGSMLALTLTVTDRNEPAARLSQLFNLTINPVDDAPRDIVISSLGVPELTPGAVVGVLSTTGLTDAGQARYEVSDPRFEVVEGVLKLREDAEVSRSDESSITLSVTAIGNTGASITVIFPLVVIPPRSPWQNPFNPPDVNGDGRITARDVLQVINYLNSNDSDGQPPSPRGPDGSGEPPPFHPDVNGDGRITALDALLIINLLNARVDAGSQAGNGGENSGSLPEGEAQPDSHACPQVALTNSIEEAAQNRRRNLQIDSELELLLEHLASDKHR